MSTYAAIKVVSSKGDIVTYEEHCTRLTAYFEEIKAEAVKLTQPNTRLTSFIQKLELVFGGLYLTEGHCTYYQYISRKGERRHIPPQEEWRSSVALDDNGYPLLVYSFFGLRSSIQYVLVHDFFVPKLVTSLKLFQELVKDVLVDNFGWAYVSSEKRDQCIELTFHHKEIDIFWFIIHSQIKVLIGTFDTITRTLTTYRDMYVEGDLFIIDIEHGLHRPDEEYTQLLAGFSPQFSEQKLYTWTAWSFGHFFDANFRTFASYINEVLKIGVRETYLLGEALSDTMDSQDELIKELRELRTGDGTAHETLIKRILAFCFSNEFLPFTLKDQVETYNKKRRRDFIINNTRPKEEFWKGLKAKGVEKILFDAKNYQHKLDYDEIASTLRYLKNAAFGNFMVIISRVGMKDYKELLEDYLVKKQVVVILTDEDVINMINAKREGKSSTSIVEQAYHDFLDMV